MAPKKPPSTSASAPAEPKGKDDAETGIPPVELNTNPGFFKSTSIFWIGIIKIIGLALLDMIVGYAIACRVYTQGNTALFDKNIVKLAEGELGYMLIAAAVFNLTVHWVNNYPVIYKSMIMDIMGLKGGNLRANMQIYKPFDKDASCGYVVLETEGAIGKYNRANRSLTHMVENSIPMAVMLVLCGSVFPFPTLALTGLFGVGRVMHQVGYATVGYGGHGLGFVISQIARGSMQGLCLLAADRSLNLGVHQATMPYYAAATPYFEQAVTLAMPYYEQAVNQAAALYTLAMPYFEQAAAAASPYVTQAAAALKIEL
jgi:hypothetical protein